MTENVGELLTRFDRIEADTDGIRVGNDLLIHLQTRSSNVSEKPR